MTATYNGIGRTEEWENLRRRESPEPGLNVGRRERWISAVAAAAVTAYGLRRQRGRKLLLPVAGALLSRAVTRALRGERSARAQLRARRCALELAHQRASGRRRSGGAGHRSPQPPIRGLSLLAQAGEPPALHGAPRGGDGVRRSPVALDRAGTGGQSGRMGRGDSQRDTERADRLAVAPRLRSGQRRVGPLHADRYRGYRGACRAPLRSAGRTAGSGRSRDSSARIPRGRWRKTCVG